MNKPHFGGQGFAPESEIFVAPAVQTPQPRAAARLIQQIEEAWSQQDYQKSIALLEQASRADPSDPSILINLARAHGSRYDYAAAEKYLEKAVQISPQRAEALAEAGRACLEFEHIDMAIRYLERSGREKSATIGVLITLADLYLRDGRVDDAADTVARAAWIDRNDPRIVLEQAALHRTAGRYEQSETLLRSILSRSNVLSAVRMRALYDLAAILDRTGRYDGAMAALLQAKAMLQPHAAPYAATLALMQRRATEMSDSITTEVLDRWRAAAAELQPPRRIALLCGHPRSGTTLLEQMLDAHSDLVSAEETRIMHDEAYLPLLRDLPEGTSIFDALEAATPDMLRCARENYFQCTERFMRKPIAGRLLIDKNPALNVMTPMVVRVFPETKLLVAVRDPRDVVLSCFMQALPLTPISSAYLSLESTVKQYASSMGFWLDMQPRMDAQWIHVRYEELVDDLRTVARSVLGFLGVAFDETVVKFHEHARTKRVKSPSYADVVKPVYRTAVGRWRNYEKYLEPCLGTLERFLKAFQYA